MKFGLFAVYDSKAAIFMNFGTVINNEAAMREFKNAVQKVGHQFNNNPEDYSLYRIATVDDANGEIEAAQVPMQLMTGFDVLGNPGEES